MREVVKVIFIGSHFYDDSGSRMSSVYREDWTRYDFGFMQCDLRDGKDVVIRQATPMEVAYYDAQLAEIKASRRVLE